MKVIRGESLTDKIKREIDKSEEVYGGIVRIELTLREFSRFVETLCLRHRILPNERVESGAYVDYKGVCIQTHEDYE